MPARIGIITYSTWGHVNTLADAAAAGVEKSGNIAVRYNIAETLSTEILGKMHAAGKPAHPDVTPNDLKELDGFIFAFPTRYGRAPAQVSTFFDATGGLWASGALVGKFGGIITSSGSQHGGQETTALTTIPFFAHQGIIFVPIGFARKELSTETHVVGGSAYGASSVAGGTGGLAVLDEDKAVATYQGENFATIVETFLLGKAAIAAKASSATPADVTGPVAANSQPSIVTSNKPVELGSALEGYAVPATAVAAGGAAVAATTSPLETKEAKETLNTASETPLPKPKTPEPAAAAPATNPDGPKTAATATPAKTTTPSTPKKKGGFFSCCGGDGSNLKA